MNYNNKPTAAQPLDLDALDKLEALALAYTYENGDHWYCLPQIADGITYEPAANFITGVSPATILALIAHARAAQPEIATGTTGATVPTWRERLKEKLRSSGEEVDAQIMMEAMYDEIADLRAQLAAKGQGKPVAEVIAGPTVGCGIQTRDAKFFDSRAKVGDKLYLGAPASAQPDSGAALTDEQILRTAVNSGNRNNVWNP